MKILIILMVAAVLLELIASIIFRIYRKKFHLIQDTETSKITTLKKGFYEIKGKIVCQSERLVSPFSKKSCVYYRFSVDSLRSSGKSSHWVSLIKDEKHTRFAIQDSSGMAMIDLQGAKLNLNKDVRGNSGLFKKGSPELEVTLNQYGKTGKSWFSSRTLRYEEVLLTEDDELYVHGEVTGFESYYPVFKKTRMPYLISDKPEDELLKSSGRVMKIASIFLFVIPGAFIAYLFYHFR